MSKKTTVKQLKNILSKLPDDLEVVIYPKYTPDEVDGFKTHSFKPENVCLMEPSDSKKHVAIIF